MSLNQTKTAALCLLAAPLAVAAERPRILGVSHIGVLVSDADKSREPRAGGHFKPAGL